MQISNPAQGSAASPTKKSSFAKGREGLLKSFRTGELEKVVDKMEEGAEAEANGAPKAASQKMDTIDYADEEDEEEGKDEM